ncbi:uncharacterized protein TNIN_184741 [Trichonephila inaurata madagascariensis]|uniref:Uncharacterized protein n=1 Tax=Trichonephila inaurata madagascariensis TaxID=2747483 RepID=A0A8X7BZC4_9ARAC|nr:uncharacterized protein TNIN_184741 [Trichonephila inaurata madagascariensis]
MGKKDSRRRFSEAIDPRFTGTFKNEENKPSVFSQHKKSQKKIDRKSEDIFSKKLFDYIDSQIEEVEIPIKRMDLLQFQIDDIHLLPGLPVMCEKVSSITEKINKKKETPSKKKRKKEKYIEKDIFKQVVVTTDFLKRQAEMFNS